jgi:hypothetical protein
VRHGVRRLAHRHPRRVRGSGLRDRDQRGRARVGHAGTSQRASERERERRLCLENRSNRWCLCVRARGCALPSLPSRTSFIRRCRKRKQRTCSSASTESSATR